MSKSIIFLISLIALIHLSCQFQGGEKPNNLTTSPADQQPAREKEPGTIRLIGELPEGKSQWFYYIDEYDDTHPPFVITAHKDTVQEIHSSSPILLLSADTRQIPYLVYPGETIRITNDNKLKIKGNPVRNNELSFFERAEKSINEKYQPDFTALMNTNTFIVRSTGNPDFQQIINTAEEKHNKQISFLHQYIQQYPVSACFSQFCEKYFYYTMIVNKLLPFLTEKYDSFSYPQGYLKDLAKYAGEFSCDSCVSILPYRMAANVFIKYLTSQRPGSQNEFSSMWEIANTAFSGKTKNYLLFHLAKLKTQNNPTSYHTIKNKFLSDCTEEKYKRYLNTNYDTYRYVKNSPDIKETAFINRHGDMISWDEILKENAGKVIYVDFWASWCVPCRKEMPASKVLRERYKDKQVAFVYVSIDEKRTDWLNAIKEIELPEKGSYLLLNAQKTKFSKFLKIYSIPRYLLIDGHGNISRSNAPRPSDHPKIDKEIGDLLSAGERLQIQ